MNWKEYDLPGIINGEEVESIAEWFEENAGFVGALDITIPEQVQPRYRICVKKDMVIRPVLTNTSPMPQTQMVGVKVGVFAGYYIMDLQCEEAPHIKWRGKVPKQLIVDMEEI